MGLSIARRRAIQSPFGLSLADSGVVRPCCSRNMGVIRRNSSEYQDVGVRTKYVFWCPVSVVQPAETSGRGRRVCSWTCRPRLTALMTLPRADRAECFLTTALGPSRETRLSGCGEAGFTEGQADWGDPGASVTDWRNPGGIDDATG